MREFQDKKRFKKLLYSKWSLIVLVILILLFINATWKVYKKEQESSANALESEAQLSKLEDRNNLLNSEISRLGTESGIEEEIRSKYSVSKQGENMLIIVDNTATDTPPAPVAPTGFWSKVKGWFK